MAIAECDRDFLHLFVPAKTSHSLKNIELMVTGEV